MRLPRPSPLKQIRKTCLECCGGSIKTIRFCHSVDCHLWLLRFGKYPRTFAKENGKKFEQLFDKENFKVEAKFSPDEEISTYEL